MKEIYLLKFAINFVVGFIMFRIDPLEARLSLNTSFNEHSLHNYEQQLEEHQKRFEQKKRDEWLYGSTMEEVARKEDEFRIYF